MSDRKAAGQKADETPRRFLSEERWIDGEEIVDCRDQVESMAEGSRAEYFEVRGTDQHDYLIKHDSSRTNGSCADAVELLLSNNVPPRFLP